MGPPPYRDFQIFPDMRLKYDSIILHTVGPVTIRFPKIALSQNEGPTYHDLPTFNGTYNGKISLSNMG